MICFPNAKINLGLNIIEKRSDGFHNIQTLFYPINWHDALEAIENKLYRKGADKISLAISGIKLGSAKSNLVTKAYRLLDENYNLPPVKAHLLKSIPAGAGLGGGSSDAAFFINLLNDKFNLQISHEEKLKYAAKLGSDCAFFIENKPVFAAERGNVFSKSKLNLSNYKIVVVHPAIHSNTAGAYKGVIPAKPEYNLQEVIDGEIKDWKEKLGNNFEKNIFFRYPDLENIKSKFYDCGALYASMSGSGSAVFGIFEKEIELSEFNFPAEYLTWKG
ncbi:MAG TPA: 4-(cytidine 5'-diphospho)-2-C-methyl-D-erythritol kinase [Bacteroidia bacterium]|nr:4-(cytidine 5'-diphospho)-2-C-methyl-D-erythritol kinase [Bacteroidia bacterium]